MKLFQITLFVVLLAVTKGSAVEAILTDDTFVKAGKGNGAKPIMMVNSSSTSFVKFDLSTLPVFVLPQQIKKATLKLYAASVTRPGFIGARVQSTDWNETTAPFPSQADAVSEVEIIQGSKKRFVTFDVTGAVQDWILDPSKNFGLALTAQDSSVAVNFDSKEGKATGHHPQLIISTAEPIVVVRANLSTARNYAGYAYTNIGNWSEVRDSMQAFNAESGVFTAPLSGLYQISFSMRSNSRFFGATEVVELGLQTTSATSNGTILCRHVFEGNVNGDMVFKGNATILLDAGAQMAVQIYPSLGSALTIPVAPVVNWISIVRLSD